MSGCLTCGCSVCHCTDETIPTDACLKKAEVNSIDLTVPRNEPEQIKVPYWWMRPNGSWIARFALDPDHPESEYSYIKNVLKLKPEDYGVFKNQEEVNKVKQMSHDELVQEVIELRKRVYDMEKAGF